MNRSLALLALSFALAATGCTQPGSKEAATVDRADRPVAATAGRDEVIPLDRVPDAVMKAARAAVPGFEAKAVEKEVEDGRTLYSLEGTAGGKACEVEVTADGKVLEIENEEDGDDGEDDDGEDDDDGNDED